MKEIWSNVRPVCVVLCAGRGTRFGEEFEETPKVLVEVNGKPLLWHVVEYWKNYCDKFVFIVGFQKQKVVDFAKTLGVQCSFIEQTKLNGIAKAVELARPLVGDKFAVVLGDCLCKGDFDFPKEMDQAVGVWRTQNTEDITRSYAVELDGLRLMRVVEKPKQLLNDFCGMGFYFFDKKVFDYIAKTPPSNLRNEVEITDVIGRLIESGQSVGAAVFKGEYLNLTYKEDLPRAEKLLG
ncbi:MAG: NDP-sugar synthase [Candidatus Micrarchaeia archaeon]